MTNRPKSSDIDTDVLLGLIAYISNEGTGMCWVRSWDIQPLYPDYPWKLVHAKLSKMIRRGLLDGCDCGCRGDYTVTDKGIDRLVARGYLKESLAEGLRHVAKLNA